MKINKGLAGLLALTIVLAGAAAVDAIHPGGHHGPSGIMGPGFRGLKIFIQLNLSDSQKSEILSIIEKYENERESLGKSLSEARENVIKLLESEQFNEDEIRNALRRTAPIREELLVMRAKMMAELKRVLTPEQLQLLEERKAQRIGRLKAQFGTCVEDSSN